jgi:probable DNA metabolism protein
VRALLYDGSWEGFLSGVFACFEHKPPEDATLLPAGRVQPPALFEPLGVAVCPERAARVEAGMYRLGADVPATVYKAWLSEKDGMEDDIVAALRVGFAERRNPFPSLELPFVRRAALAAKSVGHEAQRLLGLLRFTRIADDLYGADFGHDYNLLPLIGAHFHTRFPDRRLIIRDTARRIAILSDPSGWSITPLPDGPLVPLPSAEDSAALWKRYFKAIANPERLNPALQRRFVPLKYRQYITEFE